LIYNREIFRHDTKRVHLRLIVINPENKSKVRNTTTTTTNTFNEERGRYYE
jgi:hypothetical protein